METTSLQKQPEVVETRGSTCVLLPSADIYETADGIILIADLPGADESSVELTVHEDLLTIEGRVKTEEHSGLRLAHREYGIGDFRRQFRLSAEVDRDKIKAEVKDGVLKLTLGKVEAAKPRKIEVKAI